MNKWKNEAKPNGTAGEFQSDSKPELPNKIKDLTLDLQTKIWQISNLNKWTKEKDYNFYLQLAGLLEQAQQILKDGQFTVPDPQRLNQCLICLHPKTEGYYCSEHQAIIQAAYEVWKWDQERETRQKLSQAIHQHLANEVEHACQPTHCLELKTLIEKEVFHG